MTDSNQLSISHELESKPGGASMTGAPLKIYFAGALFKMHDLAGNALLGEAIARCSQHRYGCVLPQDLEQIDVAPMTIRNSDFQQVVSADLCLFNFDGTDLDSGTVAEFMMAKILDIPSVLLRTDFRLPNGVSDDDDGDLWNCMCGGFPRKKVVLLHSMAEYQRALHSEMAIEETIRHYIDGVAGRVIAALDAVRQIPPIYSNTEAEWAYQLGVKFPGSGFAECFTEKSLGELIQAKRQRGLL